MASSINRVRIALVVIGILYAWTAYGNYERLRPWLDGSLFETEPTGEIKRLIDLAYFIIVFTGVASLGNFVLAAIAGKKPMLAIYISLGIFAIYTALRLYQTDGGYLSTGLWWGTALVLGIGFQAAYQANQLRKSQQLANARVVV